MDNAVFPIPVSFAKKNRFWVAPMMKQIFCVRDSFSHIGGRIGKRARRCSSCASVNFLYSRKSARSRSRNFLVTDDGIILSRGHLFGLPTPHLFHDFGGFHPFH